MESAASERECTCKLGRVADHWGTEATLSEIEANWREGTGSLRELADDFNRAVLRSALERNGHVPLEGETENLHRLLTDVDVSGGMRAQAQNRLAGIGIDVDALVTDFVSYQTVNRHLQGCRDIPANDSGGLSVDEAKDRLYALRNRTTTVSEETLYQLANAGAIEIGAFEVVVDIGVTCTDCGSQLNVVSLLSRKECQCPSP